MTRQRHGVYVDGSGSLWYGNHARMDVSRTGKQVDNCVCEAFNGALRRESLVMYWFADLAEAQAMRSTLQEVYNYRVKNKGGPRKPTVAQSPSVKFCWA